jgi:glucokinase
LIDGIAGAIDDTLSAFHCRKKGVAGVGLGLPGPIDTDRGIVHFFPNIPGWSSVPFAAILKKKISLPVFIDNDANVMALAEFKAGAAKGSRNAVCLTLGTGVGGGLILDGRLYRGSGYAAGEIGHMPLNEAGPKCNCGGSACLESYIGNRRISARVKQVFGKDIPLEEVSRMANAGNARARRVWTDVGNKLGVSLAGIVNLLNPDCIVIGGGVAKAGRLLFDTVKKTIRERAMSVQAKIVKVVPAKLGYDAGLIGAGFLVKGKI